MGLIYMYTNKLNGKKYVGQTIQRLNQRDSTHISMSRYLVKNPKSATSIDIAIKNYGRNNFKLEILEDNIPNSKLDEKEKFYIEKYDTFRNGYNESIGGKGSSRFYKKEILDIVDFLKYTSLVECEIAKIFSCSVDTISYINTGKIYRLESLKYPIREFDIRRKFSISSICKVAYLILHTDKTFHTIANETDTTFSTVCDVNRGKRVFEGMERYTFPLRKNPTKAKVSIDMAKAIIEDIKKHDKSFIEIANKYGIYMYTVGSINKGKHSVCKYIKENYPIRKNNSYRSHTSYSGRKVSDSQIKAILDSLLNTTLNLEEIAQRYSITRDEVSKINRGIVFKPLLSKYKLPIRQNQEVNLEIYYKSNSVIKE